LWKEDNKRSFRGTKYIIAAMILKNKKQTFLGTLCIVMFIVILIAGLWPFSFSPENGAHWLHNRNGISFNGRGIVYSHEPLNIPGENLYNKGISIEILLIPNNDALFHVDHWDYAQIFSLFKQSQRTEVLTLGQWESSFIVRSSVNDTKEYKEIELDNALETGKTVLMTITSETEGTTIYKNGKPEIFYPDFVLITEDNKISGQIILGNSSTGKLPSWQGNLLGLAIYNRPLSKAEVFGHYQLWLQKQEIFEQENGKPVALYLFDEGQGTLAINHAGPRKNLIIPNTFKMLQKSIMTLPEETFSLKPFVLKDVIVNTMGFIIFGLVIIAYIHETILWQQYKYLIVVILCGFISLGIETVQVFLPSRTSSVTDLTLNIFGAFLVIILFPYFSSFFRLLRK
jgi:VanZ family protein